MSSSKLFLVVACLLIVACQPTEKGTVESQIKGNQGVLLSIENANDLDHLYFNYYGPDKDGLTESSLTERVARQAYDAAIARGASPEEAAEAAADATERLVSRAPPQGTGQDHPMFKQGMVQVGELNLLIHNVGGSVTAGGIFISGYDPLLIEVASRMGQNPINKNSRDCFKQVSVLGTGQYDITLVCEVTDTIAAGVNVNSDSVTVSGMNIPLAEWADSIASKVTGEDVNFFTSFGLFTTNRVDCTRRNDGTFGCSLRFGNPAFNPNRASHGYLLLNLFYADLIDCVNHCRVFPPRAPLEALEGVQDVSYPTGEALYYDYDIFLNAGKWNPLLNDLKQTFQVTACYLYTTTVTPTVCVDPDPSSNINEPCSTTPVVFKGTQGAPIRVSKIEQRSQPGGTAFTIHVEHVGNGRVWLPGAFEQCSPWNPNRPDRREMDAVQLLDARISGDFQQLRCLPEDSRVVRLNNGKGQVTCLYPVNPYITQGSRQAYQSAITLEFGYVYENVVKKEVIIHRT